MTHDDAPTLRDPALARLRVLVVDDDDDSVGMLRLLVRRWGHEAETAGDGESALRVAAEFRPHVAVLDLSLPDLDGFELARRLRSEPWARELALIALSGWGRDSDLERSHAAGFHLHLVKPVEPSALETVLDELSRRGATAD